jgi:hypothetical protein
MERREFLKTLGLGSIALTLPKPLGIVAARMEDLTAPPLHAGLARFRGLAGVMVNDFSISCAHARWSDTPRYMDFINTWEVHLAAHENGESYIPILKAPVKTLLAVKKYEVGPAFDPKSIQSRLPSRYLAPTMCDVWLVPCEKPKYALPPITVTLHGQVATDGEPISRISPLNLFRVGHILPRDLSVQVRTVRLERARAIELGLVSPSDPFEAL